jgi:hypothetical protein
MNRRRRRAQQAEQRKAQRRGEIIALAHRILTERADHDGALIGGTLILPSGEAMFIDADLLRRGGGHA